MTFVLQDGCSPLNAASYNGHLDVVTALLEAGANINQATKNGWSPLNVASWKGHLDVVNTLLEAGANINQANNVGKKEVLVERLFQHLQVSERAGEDGSDSDSSTSAVDSVPNPELQDHSGLCGNSLIPAPKRATLPVTQRCDLPSKGVQRLQEPIHLKPTRLPLTVEMLGHMLQRLETAPLKRHDRRMLRAALTLGFFGFLRVSEITLKNRRFDPSDGRPLTSKSFRSTFLSLVERCGYNPAQYNTHSLRIGAATAAARAGLPTETIQKLGRWRSSAYQTYTRHPLTHPSDTRTMAAQ
ncbi:hypothetical protein EMCRGX_G005062 [Ephydatia muelleri]